MDKNGKKFKWINEEIVLDFPLPKVLQNTIVEAEEADLANDAGEYLGIVDAIDVLCKEYVVEHIFTQEQWDLVVSKYPYDVWGDSLD